jgi:hypothetical protein
MPNDAPTLRPGCGDLGGYNTHRYHREPACPWCAEAHNLNSGLELKALRAAVNQAKKAKILRQLKKENAARFAQIRAQALAAMGATP